MSDLDKELKRLGNLKQNRKKSPADLEKQAMMNCWKRQLKIDDRFLDKDEKKTAEKLFDNYIQNFEFSNYNEVSLLADLVYEEILLRRIQDEINKISEDEKIKFIPDKAISSSHDVQDRIAQLKERLGIINAKEKDDLTALQILEKKFETYINFNRNEFTLVSPCCGKMLLLRRRVKDFDVMVHPYFSGRFWYSPRIINDVIAGILTKEQAAKYLYTSPQYIQWAIDNRNKIVSIEGVDQKIVDGFVASNPYLKGVAIPSKILEENK